MWDIYSYVRFVRNLAYCLLWYEGRIRRYERRRYFRNTSRLEEMPIHPASLKWRGLLFTWSSVLLRFRRDVRVCLLLLLPGPPRRVNMNKMFRKAIRAVCHSYSPTTFLVGGTVRLQNRQLNIHEYQVSLQLSVYSTSCGQLQSLSTSDRAPNF